MAVSCVTFLMFLVMIRARYILGPGALSISFCFTCLLALPVTELQCTATVGLPLMLRKAAPTSASTSPWNIDLKIFLKTYLS